jgi:uncharacterized protein YdaT
MKATLLRSSKGTAVVKKYVKAATSQNVIPAGGDWAIKKSNSNRITKVFDNQRDAITQAIKIAINQKSEVIIREKDDFPPRG